MSGLFELLIIVAFIAAAAFDAVKRNRQREERKREMEEREAASEEGREGEDRTRRTESMDSDTHRDRDRDRPSDRSLEWQPERNPEPESERETAESMVPEDLWAILTGQAPQQPGPEPQSERRSRPSGAGESYDPDDPPEHPHIPAPVPSDRTLNRGERAPDERRSRAGQSIGEHAAPTRRSSRWMEGVDEVDARDRDQMAESEAEAFGTMEEPWDLFDDISSGEIVDGEGGAIEGSLDSPYGARAGRGRRGSGRGQYTRLLETGRLDDLRKAVVLREVLGRPAGFRQPGDDLP